MRLKGYRGFLWSVENALRHGIPPEGTRKGLMGNTKTYYIEGELRSGITLEQFKSNAAQGFNYTYCVAEIVEPWGGYLGTDDGGPYLVAAIHSYSMRGDL